MRVLVAYEETYSFYRSVITRAIEYHRPHLQVRSVALEVFQETLAVRRARVDPGVSLTPLSIYVAPRTIPPPGGIATSIGKSHSYPGPKSTIRLPALPNEPSRLPSAL
jgi:hypothetical protein